MNHKHYKGFISDGFEGSYFHFNWDPNYFRNNNNGNNNGNNF